jgi:hypothetical protein
VVAGLVLRVLRLRYAALRIMARTKAKIQRFFPLG